MGSIVDRWPLFGLTIRTPRLELRLPRDEDMAEALAVVDQGIHDPAVTPFHVPWTDTERRPVITKRCSSGGGTEPGSPPLVGTWTSSCSTEEASSAAKACQRQTFRPCVRPRRDPGSGRHSKGRGLARRCDGLYSNLPSFNSKRSRSPARPSWTTLHRSGYPSQLGTRTTVGRGSNVVMGRASRSTSASPVIAGTRLALRCQSKYLVFQPAPTCLGSRTKSATRVISTDRFRCRRLRCGLGATRGLVRVLRVTDRGPRGHRSRSPGSTQCQPIR